jgi:hypothetical protein
MVHTIPPSLGWALLDRRAEDLRIEWRGSLRLVPGEKYEIRLDLLNATGQLVVGDTTSHVSAFDEGTWLAMRIPFKADTPTVPIAVHLQGRSGSRPAVRLFWKQGGGTLQLIPPQAMIP